VTRPALSLVQDGTVPEDGPQTFAEALTRIDELERQVEMMERDLRGKRLRIGQLEHDRMSRALSDPQRPEAELIHALWLKACGKRRPMDATDYEQICAAIRKLGFATCIAAVAGAKYDPNWSKPQRNGKRKPYNDLELIFRSFGRVIDFAGRVPDGWRPDATRIAALGGVSESWVRGLLGEVV
jgi:hypothetical protein